MRRSFSYTEHIHYKKYECITIDTKVSGVKNDIWHPLDNYVYYGWLNTYWRTCTLLLLLIYTCICVHVFVCVFVRVSLYMSMHLHFQILTTLKMLTIVMIGYICCTASTLLLLTVRCTRYQLSTFCAMSSSVHQDRLLRDTNGVHRIW